MTAQVIYQILNFVIGALVLGTLLMSWMWFMRWKHTRESDGKILAHFFGPAGWYYELCDHDGSCLRPPEKHKMQGNYFISNECLYMGKWPPGSIKFTQVGVPCTAYIENEREPIVATDPDRWIKHPERHKITAIMERHAINESSMKTIAALQTGVWKDIASMAQFIKRVPLMFLISLGNTVVLLGCLYLNYSTMKAVTAILQRGY